MNATRHRLLAVLVFGSVLLGCANVPRSAGLEVVDQRKTLPRDDFSNSAAGALIRFADGHYGRSLVELLAERLERSAPQPLTGKRLEVSKAELSLFLADAWARPAYASRSPAVRDAALRQGFEELYEVEFRSTLAKREYRVQLEGRFDGRPFSVDERVPFVGEVRDDRARRQAIDQALSRVLDQLTPPAG